MCACVRVCVRVLVGGGRRHPDVHMHKQRLTIVLLSASALNHVHSSVSALIVTLLSLVCVGVKVGGGQRAGEGERMKRFPTAVRYRVCRWVYQQLVVHLHQQLTFISEPSLSHLSRPHRF